MNWLAERAGRSKALVNRPYPFVLTDHRTADRTRVYALPLSKESARSLKGMVGWPKKPVSIEDMNSAIEKMGWTP